MAEPGGSGQAVLRHGDTEFAARDAALLRAIAEFGSVAEAAAELGRSRARALRRLETLETAFGSLVIRQRGGADGGGSQLTKSGIQLVDRYDRLAAALDAAAQVPETTLRGAVTAIDGELATVETAVGSVLGMRNEVTTGDRVQVRVGADAVTLYDLTAAVPPDTTSARNRVEGTIVRIDPGETVFTVEVDVDGTRFRVLVTADSVARLNLEAGRPAVLTWKATATRLVSTVA